MSRKKQRLQTVVEGKKWPGWQVVGRVKRLRVLLPLQAVAICTVRYHQKKKNNNKVLRTDLTSTRLLFDKRGRQSAPLGRPVSTPVHSLSMVCHRLVLGHPLRLCPWRFHWRTPLASLLSISLVTCSSQLRWCLHITEDTGCYLVPFWLSCLYLCSCSLRWACLNPSSGLCWGRICW